MAKVRDDPEINWSALGREKGVVGNGGGVTEEVGDAGSLSGKDEG